MATPEEATVAPPETADLPPLLEELGLEMVLVPAGEFLMGTDLGASEAAPSGAGHLRSREAPQHSVELDAYLIGKYPVTVAQYRAFMAATSSPAPYVMPRGDPARTARHPICFVSWHDAGAFCRWLTSQTGRVLRLPTEAEWEKAARGTDGRTYPWGEEQVSPWHCNCAGVVGETTDVRSYPTSVSPYGCLDMAGNVWEWCADWFDPEYYSSAPGKNPHGPSSGMNRVIRGGAYDSPPEDVRCAARFYDRADTPPFFPCGFRVVMQAP